MVCSHVAVRFSDRNATAVLVMRWNGRHKRSAGRDRRLATLVLLLISCQISPDDRTQGMTAQVVHAVEMTRQASNHDKRAWLDQLRKLPCKSDDVCQLKDLCAKAYDLHLMGVASVNRTRAAVSGSADSGGTAEASTDTLLDALSSAQTAQRQLQSARQQTRACAENEAVIRERYRL